MDTLATYVSAAMRHVLKGYLTVKARLAGKAFFCKALAGRSALNVCINSDMTVSCSCHDMDGSAHIGDLSRQSLEEVFADQTATHFRRQLAAGRLPTPICTRCCDLRMVDRHKAKQLAKVYRLPEFLLVENTSACNLRCLSCPRAKIRRTRAKASMSLEDVRTVAGELRNAGIRRVAYLNQGEPFLSKTIRRELEIIRELNPRIWINTSTNGQFINTDDKREAALLIDRIHVSLDGVTQQMVTKYQRGLDFHKVCRNMKALVDYRDRRGLSKPVIIWKYLLFRWNDRRRHLRTAIEMARDLGVDRIEFERTLSPYYGISVCSLLGFHRDIGEDVEGERHVVLRESGKLAYEDEDAAACFAEPVLVDV